MISPMLLWLLVLSLCTSLQAQEPLKIAAEFITPPLEFTRSRKQVGVEVDWMKEIAKHLNCEFTFIYAPAQELCELVKAGKCDLVMGALSREASEELIWTQPFLESSIGLLVDKHYRPNLLNLSDLKKATVGVLADSFEAKIVQQMHKEGHIDKIFYYPATRTIDALADLTTGQIDAFARLSLVASYLKYAAGHLEIVFTLPDHKLAIGFGVAAKHSELAKQINQVQQLLAQEGIYQKIMSKWFVTEDFNIALANEIIDGVDR